MTVLLVLAYNVYLLVDGNQRKEQWLVIILKMGKFKAKVHALSKVRGKM